MANKPSPRKFAVIGAGVAGLQAAAQLRHAGKPSKRGGASPPAAVVPANLPQALALNPGAAWVAAGYEVTLFEKSHDVGGVWQSNYAGKRLQGQGFLARV